MWTNQAIQALAQASRLSDAFATVKLGTGTTPPTAADTDLQTPVLTANRQSVQVTAQTGPVRLIIQAQYAATAGSAVTLREAGVFSPEGVLLYRWLLPDPITVEQGDQVVIQVGVTATPQLTDGQINIAGVGTVNVYYGNTTLPAHPATAGQTLDVWMAAKGPRLRLYLGGGSFLEPDTAYSPTPTVAGAQVTHRKRTLPATADATVVEIRAQAADTGFSVVAIVSPTFTLPSGQRLYMDYYVEYDLS